jgi:hypothetical protein
VVYKYNVTKAFTYCPGEGQYFFIGWNNPGGSTSAQELEQYVSALTCENPSVQVPTGVIGIPEVLDQVLYDWQNRHTDERELGVDLYPGFLEGLDPDLVLDDGTWLHLPENALEDLITQDIDDILDQDLTGVPVDIGVGTYTGTADDAITDYTTVTEAEAADETQTSLRGIIFSKFPFCIPWDIMAAFELIAAPAEAPHFEIDLFQDMDIDFVGSTEIDFDMANYPIIGQVCRWTSTVGFCISLMLATSKLIKW